jgi:hypothetical protein
VSVVCCQLEVSATSWSLVQRGPAKCGVSKSVIVKPRKMRRPRPPRGCRAIGKKKTFTDRVYTYYVSNNIRQSVKCTVQELFPGHYKVSEILHHDQTANTPALTVTVKRMKTSTVLQIYYFTHLRTCHFQVSVTSTFYFSKACMITSSSTYHI